MTTLQDIMDFLKQNEEKNCSIINFLEQNTIESINVVGKSIMVRGISDRRWIYFSSSSENELKTLKSKLTEKDRNFAVLEDWMIPVLTKNRNLSWKFTTTRLILPPTAEVSKTIRSVKILKPEDVKFIYKHSNYKEITTVDYIKERIAKGCSSGISIDGQLIAWGLTHDDGAIGFLHVLSHFRNRGYAKDIMISMIRQVRALKKLPFVQIEENNTKSMSLALTLGFLVDHPVSWLQLAKK